MLETVGHWKHSLENLIQRKSPDPSSLLVRSMTAETNTVVFLLPNGEQVVFPLPEGVQPDPDFTNVVISSELLAAESNSIANITNSLTEISNVAAVSGPNASSSLVGLTPAAVRLGEFESLLNFADWILLLNGQTVQPKANGGFLLPNVSAPDQFGPGGPGTAPDS